MNPTAIAAIAAMCLSAVFAGVFLLPPLWRHRSMPFIALAGVVCVCWKSKKS